MVNLHLKCSGMQNVEMYNIYYTPEKINFSTFPSINKLFIPCTHRTVKVTYSKDRTLTTKYSSQIKATLNMDMKETGGERKTGRCAGTCSQTHRPSQLLDTLLDTHNSAFQRAHHRLFSNAWSVGV